MLDEQLRKKYQEYLASLDKGIVARHDDAIGTREMSEETFFDQNLTNGLGGWQQNVALTPQERTELRTMWNARLRELGVKLKPEAEPASATTPPPETPVSAAVTPPKPPTAPTSAVPKVSAKLELDAEKIKRYQQHLQTLDSVVLRPRANAGPTTDQLFDANLPIFLEGDANLLTTADRAKLKEMWDIRLGELRHQGQEPAPTPSAAAVTPPSTAPTPDSAAPPAPASAAPKVFAKELDAEEINRYREHLKILDTGVLIPRVQTVFKEDGSQDFVGPSLDDLFNEDVSSVFGEDANLLKTDHRAKLKEMWDIRLDELRQQAGMRPLRRASPTPSAAGGQVSNTAAETPEVSQQASQKPNYTREQRKKIFEQRLKNYYPGNVSNIDPRTEEEFLAAHAAPREAGQVWSSDTTIFNRMFWGNAFRNHMEEGEYEELRTLWDARVSSILDSILEKRPLELRPKIIKPIEPVFVKPIEPFVKFEAYLENTELAYLRLFFKNDGTGDRVFDEEAFKKTLKSTIGPEDYEDLTEADSLKFKQMLQAKIFKKHVEEYIPNNKDLLKEYISSSGEVIPSTFQESVNVPFLREIENLFGKNPSLIDVDYLQFRDIWDQQISASLADLKIRSQSAQLASQERAQAETPPSKSKVAGFGLAGGIIGALVGALVGFLVAGPLGAGLGAAAGAAMGVVWGAYFSTVTFGSSTSKLVESADKTSPSAIEHEREEPAPTPTVNPEPTVQGKPPVTPLLDHAEQTAAEKAKAAEKSKQAASNSSTPTGNGDRPRR